MVVVLLLAQSFASSFKLSGDEEVGSLSTSERKARIRSKMTLSSNVKRGINQAIVVHSYSDQEISLNRFLIAYNPSLSFTLVTFSESYSLHVDLNVTRHLIR